MLDLAWCFINRKLKRLDRIQLCLFYQLDRNCMRDPAGVLSKDLNFLCLYLILEFLKAYSALCVDQYCLRIMKSALYSRQIYQVGSPS